MGEPRPASHGLHTPLADVSSAGLFTMDVPMADVSMVNPEDDEERAAAIAERVAEAQRHAEQRKTACGGVLAEMVRRASDTFQAAMNQTESGSSVPVMPSAVRNEQDVGTRAPGCLPSTPPPLGDLPEFTSIKNSPRSRKRARQKANRQQRQFNPTHRGGTRVPAPNRDICVSALDDVQALLRPRRKNGKGHKPFDGDDLLRNRLELMRLFLSLYVTEDVIPGTGWLGWQQSSLLAVKMRGGGKTQAESVRQWTRDFLANRAQLPINVYGSWNISLLHKGDLSAELQEHLLGVGKHVRAHHILDYLEKPEVREKYGIQRTIKLETARNWLDMMEFRWSKGKRGQYIDGHDREDVLAYRQDVFLPALKKLLPGMRKFKMGEEWTEEHDDEPPEHQLRRRVVIWYHDESTFYANDQRDLSWHHISETPDLKPKGEGASIMVADFVSADYGFLASKDGSESSRVIFKAGKNRDGYFTNEEIIAHVTRAMNILERDYPDEDHVFVFDNATTHLKRADDALAARKMPKRPSRPEKNFGIRRAVRDEDGAVVKGADGKPITEWAPMRDGWFVRDGETVQQSLYFPDDHPVHPGIFKGMAQILVERGYDEEEIQKKLAECKRFKCPDVPDGTDVTCCCRRMVYTQPDFVSAESLVAETCRARGFDVIFLPKFHCELNPIEQCWGYAKDKYRRLDRPSSEEEMEENIIRILTEIPLHIIRR
jgi:hypothetical protein